MSVINCSVSTSYSHNSTTSTTGTAGTEIGKKLSHLVCLLMQTAAFNIDVLTASNHVSIACDKPVFSQSVKQSMMKHIYIASCLWSNGQCYLPDCLFGYNVALA